MRVIVRIRFAVGFTLILIAAVGVGYPLWWNHRSSSGATKLINQYRSQRAVGSGSSAKTRETCAVKGGPGVLSIPSIGLVAPVQQGVDNAVLDVSIGHNPGTPWPGPKSAALFAAHDVSFFSRLSELKLGDLVSYSVSCGTYVFKVSQRQIADTGARITVPKVGALVLDTCWPTNALWFTSQRLIVTAEYSKTVATSAAPTVAPPTGNAIAPVVLNTNLPGALSAANLSLVNNSQLMGTMSFAGTPSSQFIQSNAPMQLEAAALTGWFAAIHTLEADQPTWWRYFAPAVAFPYQLSARPLHSTSPLEVTETVSGATIEGVSLSGALNGLKVTAHEAISGNSIYIDGYQVS